MIHSIQWFLSLFHFYEHLEKHMLEKFPIANLLPGFLEFDLYLQNQYQM